MSTPLNDWKLGDPCVVFTRSPVDGTLGAIHDFYEDEHGVYEWVVVDITPSYPNREPEKWMYPSHHRASIVTPKQWEEILTRFRVGDPVHGRRHHRGSDYMRNAIETEKYAGIAVDVTSEQAYIGVKKDPDDPEEPVSWVYRYGAEHAPEAQLMENLKGI